MAASRRAQPPVVAKSRILEARRSCRPEVLICASGEGWWWWQYRHRDTGAAPVRDGYAAAAVVLPELGGIQLAILGLHNCQDSSTLHMHTSGPACHTAYGPDELYSWPPIWICDSSGRWHTTRTSGQSGMNGGIALRLEIVPPLSRATTSIDVRAIGQSAEARARLPLRWQSL